MLNFFFTKKKECEFYDPSFLKYLYFNIDIVGANRFGWKSILVKTGVFRGEEIDPEHPADYVADNILRAVEWMLHQEEGL